MSDVQPNAEVAIDASDLSLAYPAHGGGREFQAVEGVSFSLRRGEVLAVLGESGSGKSTLTRFLAGRGIESTQKASHILATGGAATVLGQSMRKLSRRNRGRLTAFVGHLRQDAGATLPPDLNVGDIICEPVMERSKRFDRDVLGETIAEMMDMLALPLSMLQNYPFELSKGQRQRIAVMRSLIMDPALLVADEPTLGVDANNRPRIVQLLNWYRERTGATMLLISHDIGMLEALVDEVIVMQHATVVGRGQINDVFRDASHSYVQQLAEALRATAYDEIAGD
jgi:ABC-type glutathione transport system ATPase component